MVLNAHKVLLACYEGVLQDVVTDLPSIASHHGHQQNEMAQGSLRKAPTARSDRVSELKLQLKENCL